MLSIKRRPLLFIVLIFISILGDLAAFNLSKGIYYSHLTLKDKTSIHVLEVDPNFFDIVSVKAKYKNLEPVENISNRNSAIAAINGGFFHQDGDLTGLPVGILKIKGLWHGLPHLPRGAIGWSNSSTKVLFDQVLTTLSNCNTLTVIPQSKPKHTSSIDWDNATFIVGGAPILVRSSQILTDYSSEQTIKSFLYKKHARTAVGILPNGHFVFVVVDGIKWFFFNSTGITIPDLANFMHEIGCVEALNLDGGGSSTMVLDGQVINTPCGEIYDGKGHYVRAVSDAILVIPK